LKFGLGFDLRKMLNFVTWDYKKYTYINIFI
jgi:hypothetical protein